MSVTHVVVKEANAENWLTCDIAVETCEDRGEPHT